MMCRVCGGRFEASELGIGYDEYPYGEGVVRQSTHMLCPECGSEELTDECGCVQCGEEMPQTELESGFCRFCTEELEQTLEWVRSMLSPAQQRWIAEHPEWFDDNGRR